jgi:hypothetical protein
MAKNKYESQFSVYKVDYDSSTNYFKEEKNIDINNYEELENAIIQDIISNVKNKRSEISNIDFSDFKGIVFKMFHYPSWYYTITNILDDEIDITNVHVSYILLYLKDDNIFILTGGLGSNYINDYTQKNYGLYLLPKLITKTSPLIKSVLENRLSGNKLSNKHSNRNGTTINTENDMSLIFRELSLEIGNEIIRTLGLSIEDEDKKNIINVVAKDSFVIKKSISLENLEKVLDRLIDIEKKEDNFSLGYLVDVKKYGYSSKELNDIMKKDLIERKITNFILVGDEYSKYCIGGDNYIITDENDSIVFQSNKIITMDDIYDNCLPDTITKNSVEKIMKYKLSVKSGSDYVMYPAKLKNCIQGHVENEEGIPFFIFNGNWLMFDDNYVNNLDREYKDNYEELVNIDENLVNIIKNNDASLNENNYNILFKDSEKIIFSHTVLSNNIELADFIYYDDDNLYLIHNKLKFQGNGARDVLNQILTSAEFIKHYLFSINNVEIFEKYYDDILQKYPENKAIKKLNKKQFVEMFKNIPNIIYVAGFMHNLSDNTDSNYAKYITLEASKKLKENGYELKLFNINN